MNHIIRHRDGVLVGTTVTSRDPGDFAWPEGEVVEVLTDGAAARERIAALTPAAPPDPVLELLAAMDAGTTTAAKLKALRDHLPRALGRDGR